MSRSEGFLYASFAEAYMDEAFTSITTLLKHNPGAKVCLLTFETLRPYYERRYAHVPIDQVICLPMTTGEPSCFFRTKLFELSPYEKTIALDADTYIAAKILPLFDLLDTFDFVAVPDESHPARGFILGLKGGYAALNYYNLPATDGCRGLLHHRVVVEAGLGGDEAGRVPRDRGSGGDQ